jgi:hypothetical protein
MIAVVISLTAIAIWLGYIYFQLLKITNILNEILIELQNDKYSNL